MTGQAKISPKISSFYARPSNQEKLAETIHQNILPLMADYSRTLQDIYTLFIQDSSISEAKKAELAPLYKPVDLRLLFLAKLISFGMERPFIKRDTKNQKLIAGGSLSPMVLDYIMDSEIPRPCRHFVGLNLMFISACQIHCHCVFFCLFHVQKKLFKSGCPCLFWMVFHYSIQFTQ